MSEEESEEGSLLVSSKSKGRGEPGLPTLVLSSRALPRILPVRLHPLAWLELFPFAFRYALASLIIKSYLS